MPPRSTVKDPVCGMEIDPRKVLDKSEYQGKVYYFCWVGCKEKFDKNPDRYVGALDDSQPN